MNQDEQRVAAVTAALYGKQSLCETCAHYKSADDRRGNGRQCLSIHYMEFSQTYTKKGGTNFCMPFEAWQKRNPPTPWVEAPNILKHACKGQWYEAK